MRINELYPLKRSLLRGLLAMVLLAMVGTAGAQQLFVHLGTEVALNERQQHYLKHVSENPINERLRYVEVNMHVLKENSFMLNLGDGQNYFVEKNKRGSHKFHMESWCGKIPGMGYGTGDVNMVIAGEELVGHYTIDNEIYALTHIGEGLHVLYDVNSSALELEECARDTEDSLDTYPEGIDMTKRPPNNDPDYLNNLDNPKASGDCEIRVLIGFTQAANSAVTNMLAQLNNLINLANTSFNTANVNFNIELAMAYQVNYTEVNTSTDLNRWRGTNDGFMDEVHGHRSLWRADQCALIFAGGGGRAYLSLDYGNQFSVTGTNNFNVFTFHHELGHNMLCTHDLVNPDAPGTAPYAGWGNPQGCFRTIMAYQQACGTPTGCGRVNIWSRSVSTFNCGGTNYAIGGSNNRNRDRLVLSRNSVINHEVSPNSPTYTANYVWLSQSALHAAANSSITYNGNFFGSGNQFDIRNGAEVSFRATDNITLGEGFWARSGSSFDAYLDDCPPLVPPSMDEIVYDDPDPDEEIGQHSPMEIEALGKVEVFPNPFRSTTFVEFETVNSERVSIYMYDMVGKLVLQALHEQSLPEGMHRVEIPTSHLMSGIYMISVQVNGENVVKRVVKSN